jgi:subtilisin family serine protease
MNSLDVAAVRAAAFGLFLSIGLAGPAWGQGTLAGNPLEKDYEGILQLGEPEEPGPIAELLIEFKPGTDVEGFAARWGLAIQRVLRSDPNMWVLKAASDEAAQERLQWLVGDQAVQVAYFDRLSQNVPRAFVPNDPYFSPNNPPGFPGQWHLVNAVRPDLDSNVRGAWNRDLTGAGVTVGIADDGVETAHPDLAPNYIAADSWDFAGRDADPNPALADDDHGTSVAGVAVARGGNGVGGTGAAPLARLAGLRVPLGGGGRLSDFVDVIKFHSFGQVLNIKVKNHSYGVTAPFQASAGERDAVAVSAAAGTIHVWAAGNERGKAKEDANKDPVTSTPHVIAVAALASSGLFSDYSCFGANVVVTAPSNSRRQGEHGQPGTWTGIATTDRSGNAGYNPGPAGFGVNSFPDRAYTGDFGGTSSAAPLVSGIMALGVQANPGLNVRFVKHLLARTSRLVDPNDNTPSSDGGWKINAAGIRFNPNYGFGLIDADAFTRQAVQFSGVTPLVIAEHDQPVAVNAPIPDLGEVSRTFTVEATDPLEEVEIRLVIQHTFRGDLEATLTSPRGTTHRLFMRNGLADRANQGGLEWWFLSNGFWGENPAGTWTLTVRDTFQGDTGTWTSFQSRLRMGALIPAVNPTPPTITGFAPTSGSMGTMVTVTGTKFTDATAVTLNGVAANFTVVSASQLTFTVPPGAASGPIEVATLGGSATSAQSFQVNAGPTITAFSPSSGAVGTVVTITGASFNGTTAVTFNGVEAAFTVNSANEIVATVPVQASTGRISVLTGAGTASSSGNFTVTAVPAITGLSPTSGGPDTVVTIGGANFLGATAVTFNGVTAVFTVDSAIQITATVPGGAGSGAVAVVTPQGTALSPTPFTVLPPPVIAAFTPASGPAGTAVAIDGDHFLNATRVEFNGVPAGSFSVVSAVRMTATAPPGAGSGPIRVTTPSGSGASAAAFAVVGGPANDAFAASQLLAGNSGTVSGSNVGATKEPGEPAHAGNPGGRSVWYRWQAPAAGSWSFDTFGTPFDTLLAVYQGESLGGLTAIAMNDDAAGGTNSSVVFIAQANAAYRIAVDGFNPDPSQAAHAGSGSLALRWAPVTAGPVIAGFTPARGPVGTVVTLEGSGFTGATAVEFVGVGAGSFTVVSASRLTVTVPLGAVTGPIRVLTPTGSVASAQPFTVDTGPANDRFAAARLLTGATGSSTGSSAGATKEPGEPNHAGNPGGQSVWFTWTAPASGTWSFDTGGSGFDTLLAVYTGSAIEALSLVAEDDDAPDLANRASRVTFGAVVGSVYRLAVDGYVGLGGDYVLQWRPTPDAPAITRFDPASGTAGTAVVITGINLGAATEVRFNQAQAAFTVQSPTQITAVVPAGATSGSIRVGTPAGAAISSDSFLVISGPPNDAFARAQTLEGPGAVILASNVGATTEPQEPAHAGAPGGRSVWFVWTAPSTGRWTVDTFGSRFDTTLGIYTGSTLSGLTEIASNDDALGVLASQVSFNATAGTTYRIAVDGYDADSGSLILRLLPAAPSQVIYGTGFEPHEGFVGSQPLAGQGGWLNDGNGGNGVVPGLFAGLGQQAYIGFQQPTAPGNPLFLWRPLNHTPVATSIPVVRFSVLMMIVDASNFLYDDFEWVVYNRQGHRLFTLNFDNSDLGIYYRLDGNSGYVWTGVDFDNEVMYELTLVMDFDANRWSAFLGSQPLVRDAEITGTGLNLDLGDIDAVWARRFEPFAGDNFMIFDNYRVVAEGSQVPEILLQPKTQTAAAGTSVTLSVGARGAEPMTYQWRFNEMDLPGANDPVLHLANLGPGQGGSYSVLVTNPFGSRTSQVAQLSVTQVLPLRLTAGIDAPSGRFALSVSGTVGAQVVLLSSTNLVTWIELGGGTLTEGTFQFLDAGAPDQARRFYRAREEP